MFRPGLKLRARRALERQLEYQRAKAESVRGKEEEVTEWMAERSRAVRAEIENVAGLPADPRVLEVGSGAHGLIFFFEAKHKVGVDPLAAYYRDLFPAWQNLAETIAVGGEDLPFTDASFDLVLCDNVVDHAEDPRRIAAEIARVLAPGGLLYFTVNVHHGFYRVAAAIHAFWRGLRIPFEVTPFADHTVHLTPGTARKVFDGLPFEFLVEADSIDEAKREARQQRPRHAGDRLKRLFFKNAEWKVIARRMPTAGRHGQQSD